MGLDIHPKTRIDKRLMRPKDTEFSQNIQLVLLACLIGFGAGLASIAFKAMIHFFQGLFWRAGSILEAAAAQPWYWTVLSPGTGPSSSRPWAASSSPPSSTMGRVRPRGTESPRSWSRSSCAAAAFPPRWWL